LSVHIGEYYAARREISARNIVRVRFPSQKTTLTREEFEAVRTEVDRQIPVDVQAFALTWASPYRVECMSITAAFAFGFDRAYCADGCKPTRASPYFATDAARPFTALRMRPTMAIAATSFAEAKALIDRGVSSDGSLPSGAAYLVSTSDRARNVRSLWYPTVERMFEGRLPVHIIYADALENKNDVLFYFTGIVRVPALATLRFVPGAIADHLTSTGGMLTDSRQMSALRWLEAGATGSYGTVVEPCDMLPKFPHPAVLIEHYLAGETLIEAYWKSVAMPGQGIFVGEPLAAPFRKAYRTPTN
jgi:uncharacterized protein (TIGR03790 family)